MARHASRIFALLVALALVAPAAASADRSAELSVMDDQLLLGESEANIDRDIGTFAALGADRLRVSAFWNQLAPDAQSRAKPAGFDGRNPDDPRYAWAPLDRVVDAALRHGLKVMISISMPAPIWATGQTRRPNPLWKPSVPEFADFSEAVARRYAALVDRYAVSNEPNQGVWLQPQSDRKGLFAPHHYRNMVVAAYPRIKAFDPDSKVLVGELASSGRRGRGATVNIRPLIFFREMACRDGRYRRKRTGRCKNFQPIPADAIGHHPYQLLTSPFRHSTNRYDAAINDSRKLLRVIDRLTRLRALRPGSGRRLNVHYTEFGYQTSPPDPFAGVSLGTQRRYIQQAAYVVWRSRRIKEINQFRLTDGAIVGSGARRFEEFQSGLLFRNRRKKPAYDVFANPFVITGSRFWGQVRPGTSHTVRIERKATRRGRYRLVAQVLTNDLGYFGFRLAGRRPGYYRYSWGSPKRFSGVIRLRK
jgi:hypothetical protein